jgi:hypothetical protein
MKNLALITQDVLDDYVAIDGLAKTVNARREVLRGRIIARLEGGASIEGGRLTARVKKTARKSLSHERVGAVIGERALARLLRQIEATVCRRLLVGPRRKGRKREVANVEQDADLASGYALD